MKLNKFATTVKDTLTAGSFKSTCFLVGYAVILLVAGITLFSIGPDGRTTLLMICLCTLGIPVIGALVLSIPAAYFIGFVLVAPSALIFKIEFPQDKSPVDDAGENRVILWQSEGARAQMALRNYITQARKAGYQQDRIWRELVAAGWNEHDIRRAFLRQKNTSLIS